DDLFNLVVDPAFLVTAWIRVRRSTGARTSGVDKRTARSTEESVGGVEGFLGEVRAQVKARDFHPRPVRQGARPDAHERTRSVGISPVADGVVQACLKLVLERILEVVFSPSSYGFRPGRRAKDAIEDARKYVYMGYEWVFEGDITACFDEIDHVALMDRLRK